MSSKPYVQTYTAVVGNQQCDAACPYCVSKLTPKHSEGNETDVNWRNFIKGGQLARDFGASTFLLTSKGEATLFPKLVLNFIEEGSQLGFPVIELQTNGINLKKLERDGWLEEWYKAGLTTICISAVSYDNEINKNIISKTYHNLSENIKLLKKKDREFCARLSLIMIKGGIDNIEKAIEMIHFSNRIGFDQLKLYPVNRPFRTENVEMAKWIDSHIPDKNFLHELKNLLENKCAIIRKLVHGDTIYSWKDEGMEKDQNVAFGSCLTECENENEIRQIIYCSDGHIRYSWQYNGAILF